MHRLPRSGLLTFILAACDRLGIPDPTKDAASKNKAIGAACRHAVWALEDCCALNPSAGTAAVSLAARK